MTNLKSFVLGAAIVAVCFIGFFIYEDIQAQQAATRSFVQTPSPVDESEGGKVAALLKKAPMYQDTAGNAEIRLFEYAKALGADQTTILFGKTDTAGNLLTASAYFVIRSDGADKLHFASYTARLDEKGKPTVELVMHEFETAPSEYFRMDSFFWVKTTKEVHNVYSTNGVR